MGRSKERLWELAQGLGDVLAGIPPLTHVHSESIGRRHLRDEDVDKLMKLVFSELDEKLFENITVFFIEDKDWPPPPDDNELHWYARYKDEA